MSIIGEQSLRDAALACGKAGVRVSVRSGATRPLTRQGFTDATTDSRESPGWWDRCPDANVGLPAGNGGVDVDCHPPGSGFAALERARRAALVDGWSCVIRTHSGGLHFYYPAEAGCPRGPVGVRGEVDSERLLSASFCDAG